MHTGTFFGHKDTSIKIQPILKSAIIDLIENKKVTVFYIGNHGNFDLIVADTLKALKATYTYIKYYIVLAYNPNRNLKIDKENFSNTIFPKELANAHPRYAIVKRNKWMIEKSDYVITYINNPFGNAIKFKNMSLQKGKKVIELTDFT
jgi:uncharacterized phage-like protein YoqJ